MAKNNVEYIKNNLYKSVHTGEYRQLSDEEWFYLTYYSRDPQFDEEGRLIQEWQYVELNTPALKVLFGDEKI